MYVKNACMFYDPYVFSLKVTKWRKITSKVGRLFNQTEINVFWPITEGLPWFYLFYLTTIDPAHYIYNIQLAKNNFDEIILFQNSPVQPLLRREMIKIMNLRLRAETYWKCKPRTAESIEKGRSWREGASKTGEFLLYPLVSSCPLTCF